ncbi:LysR family transcriptional regulator [Streptococcus gallolyticus]|uniref:LysR family transcriptional regulator n=1 Tax=Streptococcus gallolyticus TaxID=315405 RepID=UPI00088B0E58|nr:LysR family transcriptional regulator [Streptococcus gallolyticus]SDK05072.1 DNA-binding transcriptional regulator, LysR family [Streptococcus gallolyticus]SDL55348.1 DNA-binding transcriptional regulator, LysR family [Streptococcus gallolyticus]
MNLRDLEYFYQLAKLKSYTAAAQYFQVSQPTITYAIKRLEKELGCDLVIKDPSHRSAALTLQGDIFQSHVEDVLLQIKTAVNEVHQSLNPMMAVGLPPIICNYLLTELLHKNESIAPFSQVKAVRGGSNSLMMKLLDGQLDFSLLGSLAPLKNDQLIIHSLFKKDFYVVLSPKHPLANQKELSFQDILYEKFILLDEHNIHLTAFNQLNHRYHDQASILFKIDDVSVIKQMVAENMGISLLSDIALTSGSDQLVKVPLAEQDRISFYVSYAHSRHAILSKEAKDLVRLIEKIS